MRRMQVFVLLLVAPLLLAAQGQAVGKAEAKCSGLSPNSAYYSCINSVANEFERKVERKETEIAKYLKEWNMDPEPKNAAIVKFSAAAIQFKGWRNSQCLAKAALALGGSGSDSLYDLCRIEIDEFRLVQLSAFEKELESRK